MRKMRSSFIPALLMAGLGLSSAIAAAGQSNPIDTVSNKKALEYPDVEVSPREMSPPFVRHGLVIEPDRIKSIRVGLSQADVRSLLGDPLAGAQSTGRAWDCNVKLKMPQSQNYLVCQYKVVFDERQLVSDTVWRRRQCEQLAAGQAAS